MDLLARGWSPSRRQSLALRVFFGLLFVSSPLYIGVFDIDNEANYYEIQPVNREYDEISVGPYDHHPEEIAGIECAGAYISALCGYERQRVWEGQYHFEIEEHSIDNPTPFVYHPNRNGTYYFERSVRRKPGKATVSISLEPISKQKVIDEIAIDPNRLSIQARYALLTGSVKTDTQLAYANHVIKTDGGYVMLVQRRTESPGFEFTVQHVVSVIMVVAGFVLLLGAYKALPEAW